MSHTRIAALAIPASLLLLHCSVQAQPPETEASTPSYREFNTAATIRDIMNTLVDPHADAIWNSVRFVSGDNGDVQYKPESEEEWETLRRSAIAIIEGGNALMIPGRRVAPEGATTEYPQYEYTPAEVEEKLRQDRASWVAFAQGLQNSVLPVLQAIEEKDADRLMFDAGTIDAACEACHSQYWYRSTL